MAQTYAGALRFSNSSSGPTNVTDTRKPPLATRRLSERFQKVTSRPICELADIFFARKKVASFEIRIFRGYETKDRVTGWFLLFFFSYDLPIVMRCALFFLGSVARC